MPALLLLLALGITTFAKAHQRLAIVVLVAAQLLGVTVFWWRGNMETRGWYSMKRVARDVAQPIDGELPGVVVLGQAEFFDAKTTLRDLDVRVIRDGAPTFYSTDALYYDKPELVIFHLEQMPQKYVWFVESVHNGPYGFPAHWRELRRLHRGYVQYRLAMAR